jgi:hypothetical protein
MRCSLVVSSVCLSVQTLHQSWVPILASSDTLESKNQEVETVLHMKKRLAVKNGTEKGTVNYIIEKKIYSLTKQKLTNLLLKPSSHLIFDNSRIFMSLIIV